MRHAGTTLRALAGHCRLSVAPIRDIAVLGTAPGASISSLRTLKARIAVITLAVDDLERALRLLSVGEG
jgi:hypothetical protein